MSKNSPGTVYLIGAGPGHPGLMTLRGTEILKRADAVVHDRLIPREVLAWARPDARFVNVGKAPGAAAKTQEQINEILSAIASEGLSVCRLKGGDPYIFGRGGEEALHLIAHKIPFEVVPGVSTFSSVPALAGIPVTHRGLSTSALAVTGHEDPAKKSESKARFEEIARGAETVVLFMGVANLGAISDRLIAGGRSPKTPVAIVERGATPEQRSFRGTLGKVRELVAANDVVNPSITVIGPVAALPRALDRFSTRPLHGMRIVVTRAREQASELAGALQELGARVLLLPALEIRPPRSFSALDRAIAALPHFRAVVFTSANGVRFFFDRLRNAGLDARALHPCLVYAIGPGTARALETRGITPDALPKSYVAESLAEHLLDTLKEGDRVLIPRAAEAREVLPETLRAHGIRTTIAPAYRSVRAKPDPETLAEVRAGRFDLLTFASSGTVRNFAEIVGKPAIARLAPKAKVAVIGPITGTTARELGLRPTIEPRAYTIAALVEAIVGARRTIRPVLR